MRHGRACPGRPRLSSQEPTKTWMPGTRLGMTGIIAKRGATMSVDSKLPNDDLHLIVAKDEEVVIEHHPEDWLAFVIFWSLAFIVFLQVFTRYVLNDSLSWTEEIARYGLMWVVFIGGIMLTRRNTHIAVELLSNVMKPGLARATLLAFVDVIKLGFLGLLAYLSWTIIDRMG